MKGRSLLWRVGLVVLLCFAPVMAEAEEKSVVLIPKIVIREVKITGEEFVVLQATDYIPQLSDYWIGYAGSDTIEPGTVVPVQQLPPHELQAGQAVLLTSDGAEVCDAILTTKLSVSLGDSKGTLVLRELQSSGLTSTFTTIDSVNWAKPSVSGTTMSQLDIRKEAGMNYAVWYHDPTFLQPWRVGNLAACVLTLGLLTTATVDPPDTVEWTQVATEPPAIIEAGVDELRNEVQTNPNLNLGLAPPLITELLPNPTGTGNDATDEFIELYNSNDTSFTLSGFTLQTGLSTTHAWLIPAGVTIPAKNYKVFYANESGLSMSNTSGQVTLFDTGGTQVAQSDPYDSAPDGQAWALANGTWYWTTKPTAGATNDIAAPIVKAATATKQVTTNKATVVKSATTTTPAKAATAATKTSSTVAPQKAASSALHPLVLATVALAAIGYGVYEYRHDIANTFYKLRRHGISRR